jgi:hypothetical protein
MQSDNTLYVAVPVEALGKLAALDSVRMVRPPAS